MLLVSGALEGYTLSLSCAVAHAELRREAARAGLSVREYVVHGPDPINAAVFLEDAAAVGGVAIALAGLGLAAATGAPLFDCASGLAIGLLLGGVSIFLVEKNRQLLVGGAGAPPATAAAVAAMQSSACVLGVHDVKAVWVGPASRGSRPRSTSTRTRSPRATSTLARSARARALRPRFSPLTFSRYLVGRHARGRGRGRRARRRLARARSTSRSRSRPTRSSATCARRTPSSAFYSTGRVQKEVM